MSQLLDDAPVQVLARELNRNRDGFNARFSHARARFRGLSGSEFHEVLRELGAPVLQASHDRVPERDPEVASALFDVAFEACGRRLLGREAATPSLKLLWRDLLPLLPQLVVQNPRRCIGGLCNAATVLDAADASRQMTARWIELLSQAARQNALENLSLEAFDRACLVAAWRCGLAHARPRALVSLKGLEPNLARLLMRPDEELMWEECLPRWENKPFWNGSSPTEKTLRTMAIVGDWSGFGGAMHQPPLACFFNGRFWVRCAQDSGSWRLLWADAFGATLAGAPRVDSLALQEALRQSQVLASRLPDGVEITVEDVAWRCQWRDERLQVLVSASDDLASAWSGPGPVSSLCASRDALVVTSAASHRVWVVARV
jgi:hypothetical protein